MTTSQDSLTVYAVSYPDPNRPNPRIYKWATRYFASKEECDAYAIKLRDNGTIGTKLICRVPTDSVELARYLNAMIANPAELAPVNPATNTNTTTTMITHAIVETRHFYGPKEIRHVTVYGSESDCLEWIRLSDELVYRLGHDESGRPSHEIVPIESVNPDDLESAYPASEDFSRA